MNASSNAAGGAPLSKEEINDLPMLAYEGEVMCQTEGEMARALNFLKNAPRVRYRIPPVPERQKYPTSLIQLPVRTCGADPPEPHALLRGARGVACRSRHHKAGVAIRDDIRALQKLHEFTPGGLADLAEMAKQRGIKAQASARWRPSHGLPYQQAAQCPTGEKAPHAADPLCRPDAWIGREIYLR
ncbi:MAG: 3'-5' exonuclease domain-containing protein 2 [Bilophila wadsworthia]